MSNNETTKRDGDDRDSGGDSHRVQAPKQKIERTDQVHPDWFWCLSGGVDSTAAFLLTKDALHDNYGKRPTPVYWDTGVGLPLNRIYLEELTDRFEEQLVTWRTNQSLEKYVDKNDAPGPGAHEDIRKLLKGQQSSKLTSLADLPVFVIGLLAEESENRAARPKVSVKRRDSGKIRHVEVYPVHKLSKIDCAKIILRHEECPINPCWTYNHATDCFCLANGDPSELESVEDKFPWFAQRIREIEEASDAAGVKKNLGWGGLAAVERKAKEQGQEQTKLTTCGSGCTRNQPSPVKDAFKGVVNGRLSRQEAIQFLDQKQQFGRTEVNAVAD